MANLLKKILIGGAIGIAVVVVLAWLLLSSSILSGMRGDLVARLLSTQIGQHVEIADGVDIDFRPTPRVEVRGIEMPESDTPGLGQVKVGRIEFFPNLSALSDRKVEVSQLSISGVHVDIKTDGKPAASDTSASEAMPSEKAATMALDKIFGPIITDRQIHFADIGLTYADEKNGFEVDLELVDVAVVQGSEGAPITLDASGTMNGQDITVSANVPLSEPFEGAIAFGDNTIKFDGLPDGGSYENGFSANLKGDIKNLGQLLEIAKLQQAHQGTADLSAVFISRDGKQSLNDIVVSIAFEGGQSLEVAGSLGELASKDDDDIGVDIQLYTSQNRPAPAKERRDLVLTAFNTSIRAEPGKAPYHQMTISTNGFVLQTGGFGPPPIELSGISRTPDGLLKLGKVLINVGPEGDPFLILNGSVGDALRLQDVVVDADLDMPGTNLFGLQYYKGSDALGQLTGGFRLEGDTKELRLTDLQAQSKNTDIWSMDVTGQVGNAIKLKDVALDIKADIPSTANLLQALGLEPIATEKVSLDVALDSDGTDWKTKTSLDVADSNLDIEINAHLTRDDREVTGTVTSDLIDRDDLENVLKATVALQELHRKLKEQADAEAAKEPKLENVATEPGEPTGQNLTNVTLEPIASVLLVADSSLKIDVDIKEITGPKGSSALQTSITKQGAKIAMERAKFEFAGMSFDAGWDIDLDAEPDLVNLSGSTSGLALETVMRQLKVKKGATGTLSADFELSGSYDSVSSFLETVSGTATLGLHSGSIDTQLLDIAGMGVLPWVFHKKKGKTAPLTCIRAPLEAENGRVTSTAMVVETGEVQVVVYGDIDFANKTLNLAGQPRRIGKPLSRSPWPFTLQGPFSDPKTKVGDGPRRLKRADGKDKMPARRTPCVPDIYQLQ